MRRLRAWRVDHVDCLSDVTVLTFDPYIPLALWVPLALAAAGLLATYAWTSRGRMRAPRRWTILSLMAAAAGVPLAILLNPTWVDRVPPPPGKPLLSILVDTSASMDVHDAAKNQSRYQEACRTANAMLKDLGDRYEIRLRGFAGQSAQASMASLEAKQPDGAATDLAAAIDSALEDENPRGQAILLLSDGGHNVGGTARLREVTARAKSQSTPIFTRTIGGPAEVRDLEVAVERPQELSFVRQPVAVAVSLRQRGSLAAQATLHLLLDGKELEKRTARLIANGTTEESFNVKQDAAGLYRYEVRADTLPGEVTAVNNSSPLLLRVVDQPVRVLLLEGKPYWDTKFLIRSLATDESIELTAVVQLAEGRLLVRKIARHEKSSDDQWTIEKDAGKFLADRAALASYQIVILGRNAEVFLSDEAVARLSKWLDSEDGSLVCFRGAPSLKINQRLDELMPVRWTASSETRFRAQWTDEGQSLRWLPGEGDSDPLSAMPSLATTAQPKAKPYVATILATNVGGGQSLPLVTYRAAGTLGSGRVVAVEGAGMWRWAFLPPQHQDRDDLYSSLWRSLIRWLVTNAGMLPSQRLALRPEKSTFNSEENATVSLQVREDRWTGGTPQLELTGPGKEQRTVSCQPFGTAPGQFHADLGQLAEGRYRVRVVGATKNETSAEAAFDVRGNLKERLDVAAQPANMKWIAESSGGSVLEPAEPQNLARMFDEHIQRSRPERVMRTSAWDRWWLLVGGFALWGTAWGVRRWTGLI
jgi:hypothetical protein